MNILISTWSMQIGGAEVLALNLASGLAARNHTVYVFNQHAELTDIALVKQLKSEKVKLVSMASFPWINFLTWKFNALFRQLGVSASFHEYVKYRLLTYCVKRYQIDLISSHATYADRFCAKVAARERIPFVITEHGEYTMWSNALNFSFRSVLSKANLIVTVSDYCKSVLVKSAVCTGKTIETIYNGVAIDKTNRIPSARELLKISSSGFVFGMVARGIPEKGWQQAIDAFLLLLQETSREVHLILVGASQYLSELRVRYAHQPTIHFVGKTAEPGYYMEAFDVGLMPSYFAAESLSLATVEYLFFGKPAVVTRVGGIPETIQYGEYWAGTLVCLTPEGFPDINQLKEAMLLYICNPDLYRQHAQHAQLAKERFSMDKCVTEYEKIFARLNDSTDV